MKHIYYLIALIFNLHYGIANTTLVTELTQSHEVFFETDEYKVSEAEYNRLVPFINSLNEEEISRISIYGYCDDRGSINYNLDLSNKRAIAIKEIIREYKSAIKFNLSHIGYGELEIKTKRKELINTLRSFNRKVLIIVEPHRKIADSFIESDIIEGAIIPIHTLKFRRGYSFLMKESIPYLKDITSYLNTRDDIYFTVRGYVCCTKNGKESRDKATGIRNLSEMRAKFIRDYFVKKGVDPNRIKHIGLKGQKKLGLGDEKDRRVEIEITHIAEDNSYAAN